MTSGNLPRGRSRAFRQTDLYQHTACPGSHLKFGHDCFLPHIFDPLDAVRLVTASALQSTSSSQGAVCPFKHSDSPALTHISAPWVEQCLSGCVYLLFTSLYFSLSPVCYLCYLMCMFCVFDVYVICILKNGVFWVVTP
jgi:hypothetical protein